MSNCPYLLQQFFDNSGKPLSSGKLYTYVGGSTSLPRPLFYDTTLTIPATNPLILDGSGRPGTYFMTSGVAYNFVLKDQYDVLVDSWDYQYSNGGTGSGSVSSDHKVLTNYIDTVPNYLADKMTDSDTIKVYTRNNYDDQGEKVYLIVDESGLSGYPKGPAGGDLSGTYPDPIIKQITGAGTSIPVHNRLDCEQGISISADSYLKSLTSAAILGTDATGKIISADTTPFLSGKTRVSNTDGYPDYLENKLQPYIGIAIDRAGSSNEFLNFTSLGYVCVGAGDTVHQKVLDEKLLPGNGINFSIVNNPPYGNQITISATNDGVVKTYPSDISASYLSNKLIAGAGITITSASDINGTKMILNAKGNSWRLIKYIAANYTVLDTDDTLIIRGTANITLPTPSSQYEGRIITIRSAGSFACSILGSIVGGTSLGVYQKYEYICFNNGSGYFWYQQ